MGDAVKKKIWVAFMPDGMPKVLDSSYLIPGKDTYRWAVEHCITHHPDAKKLMCNGAWIHENNFDTLMVFYRDHSKQIRDDAEKALEELFRHPNEGGVR